MRQRSNLIEQDRQLRQLREEERILDENETTCLEFEYMSAETDLSQMNTEQLATISEEVKTRFYNYDVLQWMACLMQHNLSYIDSLRRWAKLQGVKASLSNVARVGELSNDGLVYSASLRGIEGIILLKTPKLYWNDINISHEFFIGAMFTNELRRRIPNFMFVYALFKCSRPVVSVIGNVHNLSFCNHTNISDLRNVLPKAEKLKLNAREKLIYHYVSRGEPDKAEEYKAQIEDLYRQYDVEIDAPINYLVIENIPGGLSLQKYIYEYEPAFTDILGCIIQITVALDMALDAFDFCHYDLHASNVIMRDIYDGVRQTFIPIEYSPGDGSTPPIAKYFVESNYVPTIIDYGRSHVRWFDFDAKVTRHFGDHLSNAQKTGVYYDRSRPAHDLYKITGSIIYEMLYNYRLPVPPNYDSAGKGDYQIRSEMMAYNLPNDLFDNLARLMSFFPFFKDAFGRSIVDRSLKASAIEFIIKEREGPGLMSIGDKWPAADTIPFKTSLYKKFFQYLRMTLPKEMAQIVFSRAQLPPDAKVFSCEFNFCHTTYQLATTFDAPAAP